jgi:hypothetical protein
MIPLAPCVPDFEVFRLGDEKQTDFQWLAKLFTKLAQSTGPENIGPERPLPGLLAPGQWTARPA